MASPNPLRKLFPYQTTYITVDLTAGLSVFLVSLPLCLGVALASGAPLLANRVVGIVGGIVVGLLSGTAISVSGPAAGLAILSANSGALFISFIPLGVLIFWRRQIKTCLVRQRAVVFSGGE